MPNCVANERFWSAEWTRSSSLSLAPHACKTWAATINAFSARLAGRLNLPSREESALFTRRPSPVMASMHAATRCLGSTASSISGMLANPMAPKVGFGWPATLLVAETEYEDFSTASAATTTVCQDYYLYFCLHSKFKSTQLESLSTECLLLLSDDRSTLLVDIQFAQYALTPTTRTRV